MLNIEISFAARSSENLREKITQELRLEASVDDKHPKLHAKRKTNPHDDDDGETENFHY